MRYYFGLGSFEYRSTDLSHFEDPFEEDKINSTILSMPADKVPSPNDFTRIFYKECWQIIKDDMMVAIQRLHGLRADGFHLINSTNIVLIPKKGEALRVGDYMPISLIHSVAKTFLKILANRLAPASRTSSRPAKACL